MKIYIAILFCAFMLLAGCQNDSKTEQINFLVDQIGEKNILEKDRVFIVGDNGCHICYANLKSKLETDTTSHLIYYSSSSKITYDKTIFKKYLTPDRLTITYDSRLIDHISKNFGFIKSFIELQIQDQSVIDVVLHE